MKEQVANLWKHGIVTASLSDLKDGEHRDLEEVLLSV